VEGLGQKVHKSNDDALADREADLALHLFDLLLVLVQVHDEGDEAVGSDALPHNEVPLDELKHLDYDTQKQNTDDTATINSQRGELSIIVQEKQVVVIGHRLLRERSWEDVFGFVLAEADTLLEGTALIKKGLV
jgi:hypothetical protein